MLQAYQFSQAIPSPSLSLLPLSLYRSREEVATITQETKVPANYERQVEAK